MIVASSGTVGKSEILVNLAHRLADSIDCAVRKGTSLYDLERSVLKDVLGIGHAAVDLFLKNQGDGDVGATATTSEGTVLQRSDATRTRELRTIFGEHAFESFVYSRGVHRKIELRPIDARLNLPAGKASPLLEEFFSQLFCVEKAFGVGARQFEVVFGQNLSVDVLEDMDRRLGGQAERFLETVPKPPARQAGELMVLTGDGKGVPLVKEDAQQVPVFEEKSQRSGNRRMAMLACTYTVDRHVRTPEQIVAALMHDDTVEPPADRPEPCFKRYFGSFAQPACDDADAVPSAYGAFAWIAAEAVKRWRRGQPVIRLMDGQQSQWDATDVCLAELRQTIQAHDPQQEFVDIADVIHVSHYVWRGAKVLYSHNEHREAFVEDRLLRILQGDVRGVVTGLRRMATQSGLEGELLKEMTTVCNLLLCGDTHSNINGGRSRATGDGCSRGGVERDDPSVDSDSFDAADSFAGSSFTLVHAIHAAHAGRCARASAQPQLVRIFPFGCASVPVAMNCSRWRRHCRRSVSVRACAVRRCAMCWIARRVIGGVAARDIDPGLVDRDRRRRGRRDVFTTGQFASVPRGSLVPPRRRRAGGPVFRSPVPSR